MTSELSQLIEQLRDEAMADPESPSAPLLTQAAIEIQNLSEVIDLDKVDRVASAVCRAVVTMIEECWGWQANTTPMFISNDGFFFAAKVSHETWQVRCERVCQEVRVSDG